MLMELSKQIDNVIIQARPIISKYAVFSADRYFGYKWEFVAFLDLNSTDFIDSITTMYSSNESFDSPEKAIKYAEDNLESIKSKLENSHIKDLKAYIMPIEDFKRQLRKNGGDVDIISINQYRDGDFYSDDGEYKAYMIYNGNVFTYDDFDSYEIDIADKLPYDKIRYNTLSKLETAAQYLGCDVKDFKDVLFVDYPEDK